MKTRTRLVNDKITYAAEVRSSCYFSPLARRSDILMQMQSVLRQLLTEVSFHSYHPVLCIFYSRSRQTSGHRMELIIILLIAVEVVIVSLAAF